MHVLPEFIEDSLQLLRVEHLDTPDLTLSRIQVSSLLELDRATTSALLEASLTIGLLERTQDGLFVLADHHRPALASHTWA